MPDSPTLRRSVRLAWLVFYGVGTMVGAGYYALLGQVAGLTRMSTPAALALSGLLALLSAISFAELSARLPVSAGEVRYIEEGLRAPTLAVAVGWLVITTGVVSAATLSVATIGFAGALVTIPSAPGLILLVTVMGLVAAWGIGESVVLVVVITLIETGTLAVVGVLNGGTLATLPARWPEMAPPLDAASWAGVFSASFLAFYAFIGFEDMVNLAEKVEDAPRTLPRALLVAVVTTTLLYIGFSIVAVLAVSPTELAASVSPVALLVGEYGPAAVGAVGVVSILAGVNGALVQIVMASRVAYGMATRRQAPRWLGRVHHRTRTPVVATALMTAMVGLLAVAFPLTALARATSAVILVVFTLVNLSLWRLKQADPRGVPAWLPLAGATTCMALLLVQGWTLLATGQ